MSAKVSFEALGSFDSCKVVPKKIQPLRKTVFNTHHIFQEKCDQNINTIISITNPSKNLVNPLRTQKNCAV